MRGAISEVELSDLGPNGVVRVAVVQEARDGLQDLPNGRCWAPLVQADQSKGAHIAVVGVCGEVAMWRLEGILGRQLYIQEEGLDERNTRRESPQDP